MRDRRADRQDELVETGETVPEHEDADHIDRQEGEGDRHADDQQHDQRAENHEQDCPSPLKLGHYFGMERGFVMARKRHSDEDILKLLREIEVKLSAGSNVQSACRGVGISDATYYDWRKRFGGMGRSQLSEMRSLEKENTRLKKIVAELELDKLILKESLTCLKPGA